VHPSFRRSPSRWHRATISAVATATLIAGCSNSADNSSGGEGSADNSAAPSATETGTASAVGLYDDSVVHDIEVTVDPDEYAELIASYQDSSDKVWIEATVVIDGSTYEQVGLRLKGNSSLISLSGGRGIGDPDGPGGFGGPEGPGGPGGGILECATDVVDVTDTTSTSTSTTTSTTDEVASAELTSAPETLPWLIRLDKFVEDQQHEGVTELVVRSNNSETSINEAVALELLAEAGLATQEATAVRFTFNDSDSELRLVIENPNDEWVATQFDEPSAEAIGQLYKAESTGNWSYRGDDPAEYEEVWDQEAGEDNLTPLTDFLRFVNESTDEKFAAELADRLDVDAFARYLAIEDLIDNFDDISGPGNNSYLYFDPDTGRATVVAWDHNLAFTGGIGGLPVGGVVPEGLPLELPEGCELPADFQPGSRPPFDPDNAPNGVPNGGPGGGFGGSNVLVERFTAVPEFAALYDAAVTKLTDTLFTDGTADAIVQRWVTLLTEQATDLVSSDTVDSEAESVRKAFPTAEE